MEIKYKDTTLSLHYCHRIYVIFENLMSQDENEDTSSQTAQTKLVYAALSATFKYLKMEDKLTYDEVEDIIDKNGNMVFMVKFNQWFTECAEAEEELVRKAVGPISEKKVK